MSNAEGNGAADKPAGEAADILETDGGGKGMKLLATEFGDGTSLERIREILFGGTLHQYERQLNRIRDRTRHEVDDLREEVDRRFLELESYVRREVEALGDQISKGLQRQDEALSALSRDLAGMGEGNAKKIGRLGDQMAKSHRTLRSQILDESKRLTADLRRKHEETLDRIETAIAELQADRVDRATLSGIFQEISVRLNADLTNTLNREIEAIEADDDE